MSRPKPILSIVSDGDQVQDQMEANTQGQEEEEAQVLDAQGVGNPPKGLQEVNSRH